MGKTYKEAYLKDKIGSLKLTRKLENAKLGQHDFRCCNCKVLIPGKAIGSKHRNHCPFCLFSKHVDNGVGNRFGSSCGSKMRAETIRIIKRETQILHVCTKCGKRSWNRISADDNFDKLIEIARDNLELINVISEGYFGATH